MSTDPQPRVGVAVFVLNQSGEVLLGLRKGSHGAGTWALPGGHLEFGESLEACGARETLEETGLTVEDVRFATATNTVFEDERKHYVTMFMLGRYLDPGASPKVLEPDKCEKWEWVPWGDIVKTASMQLQGQDSGELRRLFKPISNLVEQRPTFHPAHYAV